MRGGTFVDSNVILDVATSDPNWSAWSENALASAARIGPLIINAVVFAEVSTGYLSVEDVDGALPPEVFVRESIPYEAAFLAAKAHAAYRHRGGSRTLPLPDFFIGAHAAVRGHQLLTRDERRYRTYFPRLRVISP